MILSMKFRADYLNLIQTNKKISIEDENLRKTILNNSLANPNSNPNQRK